MLNWVNWWGFHVWCEHAFFVKLFILCFCPFISCKLFIYMCVCSEVTLTSSTVFFRSWELNIAWPWSYTYLLQSTSSLNNQNSFLNRHVLSYNCNIIPSLVQELRCWTRDHEIMSCSPCLDVKTNWMMLA